MSGEDYFRRIAETVKDVTANLTAKGVHTRYVGFGGEGIKPTGKPRVPAGGMAEFFANRAMGDWAEERLAATMRETFPEWQIAQYGDTGRLVAGDPDFRDYYILGLEETRQFGKKPDLLVFASNLNVPKDLSLGTHAATADSVKQAMCAIEVRSSKLEALTYMRVREQQRATGKIPSRMTPSFTVKVEDLIIVYRWIERYRVSETYCQVFFDTIFAINFSDIFRIIAGKTDWEIETPAKSQQKATIMIPITRGEQIGRVTEMPTFTAEQRITPLGRHDAYVVPVGGKFILDAEKMRRVLLSS